MKYVLKGLEVSVKGKSFKEGEIDANIKIAEIELEGNFEEVMKAALEIGKLAITKNK